MERQVGRYLESVVLEVICFLVLGTLAFTSVILNPRTMGFTFTIFGIWAVVVFNALQFEPRRTYMFVALIVVFMSFVLWFTRFTIGESIRYPFWLLFIAGGTFLTHKILRSGSLRNSSFLSILQWAVSFAMIYLVMTFRNIYLFKAYFIGVRYEGVEINDFWYFARALEMGGVLGLGIGIGYVLSTHIDKWYRLARTS